MRPFLIFLSTDTLMSRGPNLSAMYVIGIVYVPHFRITVIPEEYKT